MIEMKDREGKRDDRNFALHEWMGRMEEGLLRKQQRLTRGQLIQVECIS